MDASEYRGRFPILAETTYLINHSLAAMPAAAEDRLAEYARMWSTRGIRSWGEGWWDMPLTVGDQVGRIIGARPGTTCMHQNVTVAVAVVLSCFRLESPRNRIVYLEDEFPSVRYLLQAQPGAEIEVVPDLDALLEAIDQRTLLVPLSHVLFKTAELQDVEAVQRRAEEVGAHVLLDAYQSAGAVPVEVEQSGVAFATGGSVKWLCGGPGAGWLYVRPDLIDELEPAFVGWQGHARPFAFEPELEYAEGIARFLTGTPNVPALYAATAGYDVIEEAGVEAIRRRSLGLTDLLIRLADEAEFEVTSQRDQARRGASVTIRVPGFEGVHKELAERQILCDFRPDVGLRLGPHFFNSEDELEHAIATIGEILASGVHERYLGVAARF
ncbi:MAG TPA: aminotransferase class V-fold PLP-dependent enzyme [Gaiellaceae bacterium]|nr:aminotransferase class V-fold PLP-dependent enzyme [Gaiellaceae bacterium]